MIIVSDTAIEEIKRLRISREKPDSYFNLEIIHGGCHELYYKLTLKDNTSESDYKYESQGIAITIDSESMNYIENLEIDYSEDLMGGAFRFENKKSVKICNCGKSFSLN